MSAAAVVTRLSDVLASGRIEIGFSAENLSTAVDTLLTPVFVADGLSAEAAAAGCRAVEGRECTGSTTFGDVAIPHARVPGLTRIAATLGLNAKGVFRGESKEIRVLLAFASPAANPVEHLRFLAGVAQVFRRDDVVTALIEAPDAASVLAIIRSREA